MSENVKTQFVDESTQLLDDIDSALSLLGGGIQLSPTIRVIQNAANNLQACGDVIGQEPLVRFSGEVSRWIDHRVERTDFTRDQTLTVLKVSSQRMRGWLQACEQGETPDDTYFDAMQELLESKPAVGIRHNN